MRKQLAAITIGGAALIGGGVAGAALGTSGLAFAQDASTAVDDSTTTTTAPGTSGATPAAEAAPSKVSDVLDGLVADGTLTREQADKVEAALKDAHAGPGLGHGPRGGRVGVGAGFSLSTVADALGMTEDEVRQALRDGTTVAELAASKGVDVATVTDKLVAAATDRVNQAVADGRLSQERADDLLAALPERIAALVNEGLPIPGPGRGHHRGPDSDDDSTDGTAEESSLATA